MLDLLLNISLVLVMFSIGCQIDIEHLKKHLRKPKAILLGLVLQLTMPPLLAFLMIMLFQYEGTQALGVLLGAAAPGGVTSAIVTHRADGDTELSVSMTTLNSIIISMTTLPLLLTVGYVYFVGGQLEGGLETGTILLELFLYIVLPILGALFLGYSKPLIVEKLLPLVSRFLKIYFAALIIGGSITLFRDFSIVQDYGRSVLWIAVIMITLLYLIGYFSGRSARLGRRSSKTLGIEVAFQNSGLSLSIAITILGMIEIGVPSMVYGGLMSLAALIYVAYERW